MYEYNKGIDKLKLIYFNNAYEVCCSPKTLLALLRFNGLLYIHAGRRPLREGASLNKKSHCFEQKFCQNEDGALKERIFLI